MQLAGGILFGALMHMMGMLEMVAGLVGQDSTGVGWVVHLGISALFGIGYASPSERSPAPGATPSGSARCTGSSGGCSVRC